MKKLSIIIPVYNEAQTIAEVIRIIAGLELIEGIQKEVIVINDCSTDHTGSEISKAVAEIGANFIQVLLHQKNAGKGGAIHTGIQKATGDYIIIQDADLELEPAEINLLIEQVVKHGADIVYGSRFLGQKVKGGSALSNAANGFLTWLSNVIFRIKITDMETCYKLIKTEMAQSLKLKERRFGFEPEVTAKLSRIPNVRIYEVGISYYGRTYEEGKKIGWKDGFRAIWCIHKYNIWSRR